MALKEIALYDQVYVLTPEQLDLVVKQFDKGIDKGTIDDDLANTLLLLLNIYSNYSGSLNEATHFSSFRGKIGYKMIPF